MTYHWPTDEGWAAIIALCLVAAINGGWRGFLMMLGFFVFISVFGNVVLR